MITKLIWLLGVVMLLSPIGCSDEPAFIPIMGSNDKTAMDWETFQRLSNDYFETQSTLQQLLTILSQDTGMGIRLSPVDNPGLYKVGKQLNLDCEIQIGVSYGPNFDLTGMEPLNYSIGGAGCPIRFVSSSEAQDEETSREFTIRREFDRNEELYLNGSTVTKLIDRITISYTDTHLSSNVTSTMQVGGMENVEVNLTIDSGPNFEITISHTISSDTKHSELRTIFVGDFEKCFFNEVELSQHECKEF